LKSDIEQLMAERGLDALLVTGPTQNNPAMVYFTGMAFLTGADLIVRRGQPPVLYHHPMERDGAAATGLQAVSYLAACRPLPELIREAGGDRVKALALRYAELFSRLGLTRGRVAVYGLTEVGPLIGAFAHLHELLPELTLVGEAEDSLIVQARATKEPDEVERIRKMGRVTIEVVDETVDLLTSRSVRDDYLVRPDGEPLRIGDVKRRIDLWLAEREAEAPEATIFSIGRAAGVPHNVGDPQDVIRLGQTIVMDIFPREKGGGYFYDFTRTWCVGHAPDEAQVLYEQVRSVYQQMAAEIRPGVHGKALQERTCELFEALGHPTLRTDPKTENGYVHSLGHGVGLNIHEAPSLGASAGPRDVLAPGMVVTVEPGLYYPEQGMGVRLEDTLWISPEGHAAPLVEYPMELVLKGKG
jgi:Xaa-Pro aminopeptidase